MDPALPSLGAGEPVTKAVELLEDRDALMVLDDGKPVGVLTRQDLLGHLSIS
jgi:cystathionine beta-synthase